MPTIEEIYGESRNAIKTSDIREGQVLELTIKDVGTRTFGENTKLVAELTDGRNFVINKTNAQRLAQLFGTPDYSKWAGNSFKLVRSFTSFQGQEVACLRVQRQIE